MQSAVMQDQQNVWSAYQDMNYFSIVAMKDNVQFSHTMFKIALGAARNTASNVIILAVLAWDHDKINANHAVKMVSVAKLLTDSLR